MAARRLTPAALRRLESCLALAKRGATAGERAAAQAAAERIAAAAGITLADAQMSKPTAAAGKSSSPGWTPSPEYAPKYSAEYAAAWRRAQAMAREARKPKKPPTVADRMRWKAEEQVYRRKRADAADRRLRKELAEQAIWEAEQRAAQAERDRAWAEQQRARA